MLREKDGLDYKNIDENVDATNWIKVFSGELRGFSSQIVYGKGLALIKNKSKKSSRTIFDLFANFFKILREQFFVFLLEE